MKIIGISGSPRNKNTNYMLRTVLDATGQDYELILLKDKNIKPCTSCGGCYRLYKCVVRDDMQELYDKLQKADAIVLGTPTYFANVTGIMKNFMDRCLPLYLSEKLKGKKAVLLTVGNFKKGEVKHLDNYDPEKEIKTAKGRWKVGKTMRRCIDIMRHFCADHMEMNVIGSVVAIYSDPASKKNELVRLGKRIVNQ